MRYINKDAQSAVQIQRLENYSDILFDALEKYAEEIESSIVPYNKKSTEETMMIKGLRRTSEETTNRKTHMENVTGIAVEIAKKLGLHVGATRIIAENHDIGHTFEGHSGEWWLSNIKEDYGMGYYCHNALGPAELIYRDNIYDKILQRIQEFNPNIKDAELKRIRKSLWLIFDGVNSHNGEKTESKFVPNKEKNEKVFLEELSNCFCKKGYDKGIMPATMEGCLIRLCDKISYIPYDMLDGIREGMIDKLDGEYIDVLTSLGITEEEINSANIRKNYESIARKLQITFTKDVIQNSTSSEIKMSPQISKYMHELRNINNRRIVKYTVLQEDNEIYPRAIRILMDRFSNILLKDDNLEQIEYASTNDTFAGKIIGDYEGTPDEGFAKYLAGVTKEDYNFTKDMIEKATLQSISDEQEKARKIVQNGENFTKSPEFQNRDERISRYINYYKNKENIDNYSEEDKKKDILEAFENQKNGEDGFLSLKQKLALEYGAKYLATLNDFEFFKLLKDTKLIDEKQAASLTRPYRDIDILKESQMHKEFETNMNDQAKDTKKIQDER